MYDLARCFMEQLQMTNGSLPGSLLLAEVLAARGVPCRLRSGFLLVRLPAGDEDDDEAEEAQAKDGWPAPGAAPPPVFATPHMWVELVGAGGGSGSPTTTTLDIGMALALHAGLDTAEHELATEVPPGALRADAGMGAAAGAMEAAMAELANGPPEMMQEYWAGAPPALREFRAAMLQRFVAPA